MRFASVRELSQHPSRYVDLKEPVVITKHGKPVKALVSMDEDEIEDFILTQRLGLEEEMGRAIRSSLRGKNIPSEKLRGWFQKR